MFHKDNIGREKTGESVSKSLYTLQNDYRGIEGMAHRLGSDLKRGIQGTQNDIDDRVQR